MIELADVSSLDATTKYYVNVFGMPGELALANGGFIKGYDFYKHFRSGKSPSAFPISTPNQAPLLPLYPNPANNSTGISTSPTLTWSCSDPDGDAPTYDVYFGKDNPPATNVSPNQSALSLSRSNLTASTQYFWKVIAKDNHSKSTPGPVWSFTTGSGAVSRGMVQVAGGTFTAGSTPVTISSFKIDTYEVTYELWTDVRTWALTHGYASVDIAVGRNGHNPNGTNNPVTEVSWYDIVKWCNARSEKENLTPVYYTSSSFIAANVYKTGETNIDNTMVSWTANGYRLPTEAEWEFAAKGGTLAQSPPNTYSGSNTIDDVAWYYPPSRNTTHTVGQKSPNELGIYDMSGNVSEWCWDWYSSTYPSGGTIDPKGPSTTQAYRLLRGGSFRYFGDLCRVDYRDYAHPYGFDFGFRCVQK
jgi:formylglycine-generating enzyme required for sulfatase activity